MGTILKMEKFMDRYLITNFRGLKIKVGLFRGKKTKLTFFLQEYKLLKGVQVVFECYLNYKNIPQLILIEFSHQMCFS